MSTLQLKASPVFERISDNSEGKRFIVLQGGARSSKTYTIAQYIISKCLSEWKDKIITISRKTFPSLRASVMRDFFEILNNHGLYSTENHNKTTHEYNLSGNLIEFVACDEEQKVRGRKRNICWLNEANEFTYEEYFQYNLRTIEQVFFDYNPSDEFHWIYDKIIPLEDCYFIQSNYKDNPFLEASLVNEIEKLKDEDEELWKIYGLGERAKAKDLIYSNWDIVKRFPHICEYYRYGLDFGFNHPTALMFIGIQKKDVYIDEVVYETNLTNQDLIARMEDEGINRSILIRADSAEPDRIQEISQARYLIEPVQKGSFRVKNRIDALKRYKLHFTKNSINAIKEAKNYKWKKDKKTGEILDEPIKFKDDAMDAVGYAIGDLIMDKILFIPKVENIQKSAQKVYDPFASLNV